MRHCIEDPAVGVVMDVALATDEPFPHLPITTAEFIIHHLGVGGHCFVRTPYLDTFHWVAVKCRIDLGVRQVYRDGIYMHRVTRIR